MLVVKHGDDWGSNLFERHSTSPTSESPERKEEKPPSEESFSEVSENSEAPFKLIKELNKLEKIIHVAVRQTERHHASDIDPKIEEFTSYLKDLNIKKALDEKFHPSPETRIATADPYHPTYNCTGLEYAKVYIYEFCHNKNWDGPAIFVDNLIVVGIIVSVVASCVESIDDYTGSYVLYYIEATTTGIFTVELGLRFLGIKNHVAYLLDPLNMLDILATVPFYIAILLPNLPAAGGALRVFRLTRLSRLRGIRNKFTPILIQTYISFVKDILASILILIIISLLVFGNLIVMFEKGAPSYHYKDGFAPIDNIPQGMWWTLITMTTVGYGDYYPVTPLGKTLSLFTVVIGLSITALMLLIVGELFNQAKVDADQKVLEVAECLQSAGAISDMYDEVSEETTMEDLYGFYKIYLSTHPDGHHHHHQGGSRSSLVREGRSNADATPLGNDDSTDLSSDSSILRDTRREEEAVNDGPGLV